MRNPVAHVLHHRLADHVARDQRPRLDVPLFEVLAQLLSCEKGTGLNDEADPERRMAVTAKRLLDVQDSGVRLQARDEKIPRAAPVRDRPEGCVIPASPVWS